MLSDLERHYLNDLFIYLFISKVRRLSVSLKTLYVYSCWYTHWICDLRYARLCYIVKLENNSLLIKSKRCFDEPITVLWNGMNIRERCLASRLIELKGQSCIWIIMQMIIGRHGILKRVMILLQLSSFRSNWLVSLQRGLSGYFIIQTSHFMTWKNLLTVTHIYIDDPLSHDSSGQKFIMLKG